MKTALLFLLAALSLPAMALAQTGTIQGQVTAASSGQPLSGVQISLEGTERGVLSAEDGSFILPEVTVGGRTVVATSMGFATERRQIRVEVGQTVELQVTLSEEAVEVGGITVTARRGGLVATQEVDVGKLGVAPARTPQALSVITRAQLAIQNVTSLSQAARYTPGVQTETFGVEPRLTFIRIRGFDATTSGLFQDGLQLRNPGFAVGYNLEPYGAERIEVLRGPSSVLFGAGSPGGMVNYVSKAPTRVPLREIGVEMGSFERIQGELDVSGPMDEEGRFSYRLTGLVRESETQVDFVGNDRVFVQPALRWQPGEATSFTISARYKSDDTRSSQALPAAGLLFDNPVGEIPVDRFTGEPAVDTYDRTHVSAGYELEHAAGPWTFRQKLRWYDVELDDVTVFTTGLLDDDRTITRSVFGSFGTMDGVAVDNQARLEARTGPAAHTLMAGLDYQGVEAGSTQTFGGAPSLDVFAPTYGAPVAEPPVFADKRTEQRQVGIYLQDRIELDAGLTLALAVRHDWASTEVQDVLYDALTEQDDEATTLRGSLSWEAPSGLMPYVTYSESFLPAIGTAPSGEPFKPEAGRQWEAGMKYAPSGWNGMLTVAFFDLTRENFVQYDPDTFVQIQTGETTSTGLELEATAGLRSGLDLMASLAYNDVEITESANPAEVGERPTQTPEVTASAWLDYTVLSGALEGLGLAAGARHVGATFGDIPNTLEVPSVTLVDAALQYDWRSFGLQVNAHNLFDERYTAAAFRRSSPLATFGPTRTLSASLHYRW